MFNVHYTLLCKYPGARGDHENGYFYTQIRLGNMTFQIEYSLLLNNSFYFMKLSLSRISFLPDSGCEQELIIVFEGGQRRFSQ